MTRVLVCDDDPGIQRALRVVLSSEGFELEICGDGESAVDRASVWAPDIALIDLMLPGEDGIWACSRIREWSSMPLIVLSAVGEEQEKVRALEAGADDYVTKPFGTLELLARMRAALRRAGTAESDEAVVELDGLTVDLAARAVRRDGERIHLTPTEFRLLRVLIRNRGRLATHSRLLTEVWGPEYSEDVHVLRVHTANLRGKLELDPSRPTLILTDPGVGYRLAD